MLNRKVLIGTICSFALMAEPASAANEEAGLKACAEAMMADLAAPGAVPAYRVENPAPNYRRLGRWEVFHLDAHNAKSNEVLARYDCTVNAKARVLSLETVPLDSDDAHKRSVTLY